MSLSVVMPVYNEEKIVEEVVRSIDREILSRIPGSEFIIVNDCSKDSTLSILKKLAKENKKIRIITPEKNGGHGKAIRLGFINAKKDWVFHIDSDAEYDTKEFWRLYDLKGKYDIVLGYRKHRKDPLNRLITTRLARLVNFILFGSLIKDTNSAFKLVNRKALQQIVSILPDDAFAYSILASIMGRHLKYRIIEIPVKHFGRQVGVRHYIGLKLFKGIFRGGTDMLKLRKIAWTLPKSAYEKAEMIRKNIA